MTVAKSSPAKEAAEIAKLEADAAAARASAAKTEVETRAAEESLKQTAAVAKRHGIETARALRAEQEELASNRHNHVIEIKGAISGSSVDRLIERLVTIHRMDGANPQPIEIVINSPGGEVYNGEALYDMIRFTASQGHHITTVCIGMAASMAGILFMAGDTRVMGKLAKLMIHRISSQAWGSTYEIEDQVKLILRLEDQVLTLFEDRVNQSRAPRKITKAQIKKNWERKDWWIFSDEALELGLTDEIR